MTNEKSKQIEDILFSITKKDLPSKSGFIDLTRRDQCRPKRIQTAVQQYPSCRADNIVAIQNVSVVGNGKKAIFFTVESYVDPSINSAQNKGDAVILPVYYSDLMWAEENTDKKNNYYLYYKDGRKQEAFGGTYCSHLVLILQRILMEVFGQIPMESAQNKLQSHENETAAAGESESSKAVRRAAREAAEQTAKEAARRVAEDSRRAAEQERTQTAEEDHGEETNKAGGEVPQTGVRTDAEEQTAVRETGAEAMARRVAEASQRSRAAADSVRQNSTDVHPQARQAALAEHAGAAPGAGRLSGYMDQGGRGQEIKKEGGEAAQKNVDRTGAEEQTAVRETGAEAMARRVAEASQRSRATADSLRHHGVDTYRGGRQAETEGVRRPTAEDRRLAAVTVPNGRGERLTALEAERQRAEEETAARKAAMDEVYRMADRYANDLANKMTDVMVGKDASPKRADVEERARQAAMEAFRKAVQEAERAAAEAVKEESFNGEAT